jgi:hypothetical protein
MLEHFLTLQTNTELRILAIRLRWQLTEEVVSTKTLGNPTSVHHFHQTVFKAWNVSLFILTICEWLLGFFRPSIICHQLMEHLSDTMMTWYETLLFVWRCRTFIDNSLTPEWHEVTWGHSEAEYGHSSGGIEQDNF